MRSLIKWFCLPVLGLMMSLAPANADVLWVQPVTTSLDEQLIQEMSDFPGYSVYAFDDFTIVGGTWTVSRVTIDIREYGLPDTNEEVLLMFDKAHKYTDPTAPGKIAYAGREVSPGVASMADGLTWSFTTAVSGAPN